MFERFTSEARQTVVLAQEEARRLNHNYIGTEHILLGLLREGQGVATRTLRQLGVGLDSARDAVVEIIGEGEHAPGGHIPFTPRAKKVLELSLREALSLSHNYIGTEHILLGLIREGDGVAAQVLHNKGVELERLRQTVRAELRVGSGEPNPLSSRASRTPAAEQAVAIAEQLAGSAPLGSHHLLEALARSEGSLAARVLDAAGVDVEVLAAKIDELGVDGTTDLTPEEAAARRMEVRLDGDEVHIVLRDETTVELARAVTEKLGGPLRGDDPVAGTVVGLHRAAVRCLSDLRDRLSPPPEAPESRLSAMHRAFQSRLRRRTH